MAGMQKISFIFLLGLLSCKGVNKDKPVPLIRPEREIDKVKLTDLKNKAIELKQYERKTIFINFWATWCKPVLKKCLLLKKLNIFCKMKM